MRRISILKGSLFSRILPISVVLLCLTPIFSAFGDEKKTISREDMVPYLAPERDIVYRPAEAMKLLDIKKGDVILDFGALGGYFTFTMAKAAGPSGKVYAVDIAYRDPRIKEFMMDRIGDRELNPYDNVRMIVNSYGNVPLPPESIDMAFMCLDAIFLVDEDSLKLPIQKERFELNRKAMASVYNALKPGGRLIVIDLYMAGDANDVEHPAKEGFFLCFYAARDLGTVKKNFELLGLKFTKSYDIYMGKRFLEDVKEFKKTDFSKKINDESKALLCNRRFFFVFEKPGTGISNERAK